MQGVLLKKKRLLKAYSASAVQSVRNEEKSKFLKFRLLLNKIQQQKVVKLKVRLYWPYYSLRSFQLDLSAQKLLKKVLWVYRYGRFVWNAHKRFPHKWSQLYEKTRQHFKAFKVYSLLFKNISKLLIRYHATEAYAAQVFQTRWQKRQQFIYPGSTFGLEQFSLVPSNRIVGPRKGFLGRSILVRHSTEKRRLFWRAGSLVCTNEVYRNKLKYLYKKRRFMDRHLQIMRLRMRRVRWWKKRCIAAKRAVFFTTKEPFFKWRVKARTLVNIILRRRKLSRLRRPLKVSTAAFVGRFPPRQIFHFFKQQVDGTKRGLRGLVTRQLRVAYRSITQKNLVLRQPWKMRQSYSLIRQHQLNLYSIFLQVKGLPVLPLVRQGGLQTRSRKALVQYKVFVKKIFASFVLANLIRRTKTTPVRFGYSLIKQFIKIALPKHRWERWRKKKGALRSRQVKLYRIRKKRFSRRRKSLFKIKILFSRLFYWLYQIPSLFYLWKICRKRGLLNGLLNQFATVIIKKKLKVLV